MKLKVFKTLFLSGFLLLSVVACSGRSGLLGVRSTPNEFQARSGAPLVVPESSDALPEPKLGANDTYLPTPQEEAKAALQ